ncbi:hypothetical protein GCM10009854_46840 [Saccharopolyspora halophila]|uniref:Cell division protein SepF n=1 Tax=Saccharopolyspora halophila TaxID=405551 RepID=A0ABP5TVU8_9PSEU
MMQGMAFAQLALGYLQILVWPVTVCFILWIGSRVALRLTARGNLAPVASPSREITDSGDSSLVRIGEWVNESEELTSLAAPSRADPVIHLRGTVRLAPTEYREAVQDIHGNMAAKRVSVLDLTAADERTARRIIDFCTGVVIASKGHAHKVSTSSVILIPSSDDPS